MIEVCPGKNDSSLRFIAGQLFSALFNNPFHRKAGIDIFGVAKCSMDHVFSCL